MIDSLVMIDVGAIRISGGMPRPMLTHVNGWSDYGPLERRARDDALWGIPCRCARSGSRLRCELHRIASPAR